MKTHGMARMARSATPPTAAPKLPPRATTRDGRMRHVGIEIEFGDLALEQAAHIVVALFGGEAREEGPNSWVVEGTRFGRFGVKLDAIYLHAKAEDERWKEIEGELLARLGELASHFVPAEIVGPPIPISEIPAFDKLQQELAAHGATGTGEALYYAFAMQFNPEVPDTDIAIVLNQFRAFLLMEDWLRRTAGRDMLRRLFAFANPFPRSYVRRVLDPDYRPDWPQFIDDYLGDNATRNRGLDLLPLFAHLDRPRLERHMHDVRIKARPTYHYRIPDSRIGEPGWSITGEWNRWVRVEELAEDAAMLRRLSRAYLRFTGSRDEWADLVDALLFG